ncbi:uncharacterized protein SPSK_05577 [Sporothrix schenckii 1099-18]|uniref:Uncharacterized protein n=1 Tax=Sporothrix schenckii 1099-18 TaxID=1397361 RepID=A0A0F2LW19_SPOSC|nr:uncharacterized protein SPSK_05577 [Sporothrix schenckii 1099-18]KJR80695.1 hypothetical protein SPSK_05577 [Sporothrix schenckii 1099-18]
MISSRAFDRGARRFDSSRDRRREPLDPTVDIHIIAEAGPQLSLMKLQALDPGPDKVQTEALVRNLPVARPQWLWTSAGAGRLRLGVVPGQQHPSQGPPRLRSRQKRRPSVAVDDQRQPNVAAQRYGGGHGLQREGTQSKEKSEGCQDGRINVRV